MSRLIEIDDNATNEDVLKAVFPNYTLFRTVMFDENEQFIFHDINYRWLKLPYEQKGERQ